MGKNRQPNKQTKDGQRSFTAWIRLNKSRFNLPLRIRRTFNAVCVQLQGLNPALRIEVGHSDVTVAAYLNGKWFDSVAWFEMAPKAIQGAYVCKLCCDEESKTYDSVDRMRVEHLYEPFLNWCNCVLNDEHVVQLLYVPRGFQSAEVIHQNKAEPLTMKHRYKDRSDFVQIKHLPILTG